MSGGHKAPTAYQPTGQGAADQTYQSGMNAMAQAGQNLYNTANQGYGNLYQGALNNPYYQAAQAGVGQTAQQGALASQNAFQGSQAMQDFGGQLGQFATGVQQTAFDPQQALYNRNATQMMNQQNAINAMSGVAGSPYGAGLTGQTMGNFNLDWMNQQMQRQLQGAQAMSNLGGAMGNAYGNAADLGKSGMNMGMESALAPNLAYLANQQNIQDALNALVQGNLASLQPTQQNIGNAGNYLGIGQNATALNQQAMAQRRAQDQAMWGGVGQMIGMGNNPGQRSGIAALASLFGG